MRDIALMALALMTVASKAAAQGDVEYRAEIGACVVGNTYLGDFNSSLTSGMQPGGGVVFRSVLNPHSAIRVQTMYTSLKGDYTDVDTYYPDIEAEGYTFKNTLIDLSGTYEYNFFQYGTGRDVRGAQRLTPFISMGFGITYVHTDNGLRDYAENNIDTDATSVFTANIPLGVGVKLKLGDRMNLSLDWQVHFSLSDKLDGVKDPYRISSSGIFKNTDCYSTLTLALTYSFAGKCRTCHNDD